MVSGSLKGMDMEKVMHKLYAKVTWKNKVIVTCLDLLHDKYFFHQETGNWGVWKVWKLLKST